MRTHLALLAAALSVVSVPSETFAAVINQMSFEEATIASDVVVLARVVEVPKLAVHDEKSGEVLTWNRIRIERYLKGTGSDEVAVLTLGGTFIAQTPTGPQEQWVGYGGEPSLPEVGSTALFFLRQSGRPNAFRLASVSHGLRQVVSSGGEATVQLQFRNLEVMPASARQSYESMKAVLGADVGQQLVSDNVRVSDLKALVEKANALPKRSALPTPVTPQ